MKAFVRALTVLSVGSFIGLFSACAEDNDAKAKITSDSNPTGGAEVNRPKNPAENKKLADDQMKKNMSNPDYPQANQPKR